MYVIYIRTSKIRPLGPVVAAAGSVTHRWKEGRKARKYIMMIIPNVRSLSSQTFPIMGMFD